MSSSSNNQFLLSITDDILTIKCICTQSPGNNKTYLEKYCQDDILTFGVGNFANFCKICKDVFENDKESVHIIDYNNDDIDRMTINIVYSGILEFKFNLTLSLVKNEGIENSNLIISDINFLKNTIESISGGLKNMSNEISELKQNSEKTSSENLFKELAQIKRVVELMCNDLKKMENFVYFEIDEIKLVKDDNEKIPLNCKKLCINVTDCMCCTVNKYTPHNDDINYSVSVDPKFTFNENFKIVNCEDLTINIGTKTENYKINVLPLSIKTLTLYTSLESIDLLFLSIVKLPNIKILHLKNIINSHYFKDMILNLNPSNIYVTMCDYFLRENDLSLYGYKLDDANVDKCKALNIIPYIKTI